MHSSRVLAFLLACSLASPAIAAGISVTYIGGNSAAAGANTLAITTTQACPAGSGIWVFAGVVANVAINAPTDSVSNSYVQSLSNTLSGSVARQRLFHVQPASASGGNFGLPSGSTITANFGATTGAKLAAAACVTGARTAPAGMADTDNTGTTGASTSPSLTLATPVSNGELALCGYLVVGGAADTFTNTSGFSALTRVNGASDALDWEYKATSDFTAQTCAPTLGASRTWGASARGFIQTQGVRVLTGVGL